MEEQREESEFVASKGLALEAETLDDEVNVPQKESCVEDTVSDDVASGEDMVGSGSGDESSEKTISTGDVERTDAITDPETEINKTECEGDVEVKQVDEIDGSEIGDDVETNDETAKSEVKSQNGESHESGGEEEIVTSGGKEVTGERVNCEVEDNGDACDDETLSVAEGKADKEKHSISAPVPEESTKLSKGETNKGNRGTVSEVSSATEISHEEELSNVNQKDENGEAMEIEYEPEELVEKDVKVRDVPTADVNRNDSNVVKEMEIDERKDNADMSNDLTGTIESADSANPNSPSEDAATGNIQDLKTETGNVSLKEDKKATDMAEEVATVDATLNAESHDKLSAEGSENEARVVAATECPREASDVVMGSDENQGDKDQQDTMREEDDITHEAPKEDTEMEENPNNSDFADNGTDSDVKTHGVKRKADGPSEDSAGEGRKTVSLAKVSFAQRPSFKIGACIARAASQMAGSPSVLKGSSFGDESLSVESFVSQLQCAATDTDKENVVSGIAVGFFLDFRNSSALLQVPPEKVSKKRGRPSKSNAGGTEAFEFEEMGDTYWTDRMIHNGGEEQTPPTKKGNYQVVPVELKPSQVKKTRRPYKRRQSQINIPLPSDSDKPASFDENAPAELIMKFSETDTIPPEKCLCKMFRHFGPIKESQTEVDSENNRARVVFRKGADAEVAYNSAGRFNIFGTKAVNYELSFTITEAFTVQPYVVSLGEEDAAVALTY